MLLIPKFIPSEIFTDKQYNGNSLNAYMLDKYVHAFLTYAVYRFRMNEKMIKASLGISNKNLNSFIFFTCVCECL